jgi:hypothetical protein
MLREWIVTLHKREDLEGFYEDMETPGGNLFIPDRAVEVSNKRPISRNTHYMLTDDEVELIKSDDRVWGVDLRELVELSIKPSYKITNGEFDKNWFTDASDINWGLLRHSEALNRSNWGADGSSLIIDTLAITASGKNVDVIIVDGHIDPDHPEFAVNSDGSGGSRIIQENWFSHGGSGTYTYDRSGSYTNATDESDNNHGCHCAGTVAGNTQGWARDANIYNISPYSSNPNGSIGSTMWDYMRQWHNTKPINPDTGRRNPTVTNNSYGSSLEIGTGSFGDVDRINFRGTDFNPGRSLTQSELQARGCYAPNSNLEMDIPYYTTSRQADLQDAIDDGIIIVVSAGNDYWKTVNTSDQDYNNTYRIPYSGTTITTWLHRGTGSGAGYGPTINVGALSNNVGEEKAPFSNVGSQIDIFAAGEAIQSSLHSGGIADPRNSSYQFGKYQGTSMAGPQVAGVAALLVEQWPNATNTEIKAWIQENAIIDEMVDTGNDDPMDMLSLQGAENRMLRWINQRVETGNSFPKKNFANRPADGLTYPRTRIRRRG